jgi:hypothetical protein
LAIASLVIVDDPAWRPPYSLDRPAEWPRSKGLIAPYLSDRRRDGTALTYLALVEEARRRVRAIDLLRQAIDPDFCRRLEQSRKYLRPGRLAAAFDVDRGKD